MFEANVTGGSGKLRFPHDVVDYRRIALTDHSKHGEKSSFIFKPSGSPSAISTPTKPISRLLNSEKCSQSPHASALLSRFSGSPRSTPGTPRVSNPFPEISESAVCSPGLLSSLLITSGSVESHTSHPKSKSSVEWSIEQKSMLYPADIDESKLIKQHNPRDYNDHAQTRLSRFWDSQLPTINSPLDAAPPCDHEQRPSPHSTSMEDMHLPPHLFADSMKSTHISVTDEDSRDSFLRRRLHFPSPNGQEANVDQSPSKISHSPSKSDICTSSPLKSVISSSSVSGVLVHHVVDLDDDSIIDSSTKFSPQHAQRSPLRQCFSSPDFSPLVRVKAWLESSCTEETVSSHNAHSRAVRTASASGLNDNQPDDCLHLIYDKSHTAPGQPSPGVPFDSDLSPIRCDPHYDTSDRPKDLDPDSYELDQQQKSDESRSHDPTPTNLCPSFNNQSSGSQDCDESEDDENSQILSRVANNTSDQAELKSERRFMSETGEPSMISPRNDRRKLLCTSGFNASDTGYFTYSSHLLKTSNSYLGGAASTGITRNVFNMDLGTSTDTLDPCNCDGSRASTKTAVLCNSSALISDNACDGHHCVQVRDSSPQLSAAVSPMNIGLALQDLTNARSKVTCYPSRDPFTCSSPDRVTCYDGSESDTVGDNGDWVLPQEASTPQKRTGVTSLRRKTYGVFGLR